MKEISLNILDVAQNSLRANATEINILVFFDTAADRLTVSIKDNGCGMSQEFVSRVLDLLPRRAPRAEWGWGCLCFVRARWKRAAISASKAAKERGRRLRLGSERAT